MQELSQGVCQPDSRGGVMSNGFTDKELSDYFNSLSEDERDGFSHDQFMREVKYILDPKRNAKILQEMIAERGRIRTAREEKARIDRATRNAAIGLR